MSSKKVSFLELYVDYFSNIGYNRVNSTILKGNLKNEEEFAKHDR